MESEVQSYKRIAKIYFKANLTLRERMRVAVLENLNAARQQNEDPEMGKCWDNAVSTIHEALGDNFDSDDLVDIETRQDLFN